MGKERKHQPKTCRRKGRKHGSRGPHIRPVIELKSNQRPSSLSRARSAPSARRSSAPRSCFQTQLTRLAWRRHAATHPRDRQYDSSLRTLLNRTSFRENGPGLTKCTTGPKRAKRVPSTQARFGRTLAHVLPKVYTNKSRNTVDTPACTGLNR